MVRTWYTKKIVKSATSTNNQKISGKNFKTKSAKLGVSGSAVPYSQKYGGQSIRTFSKAQGKVGGCIGKIGGQSMRGIRKISGQSVRTSASGKGKAKNAKSRHYKKLRAVICEQTVGSKQKRIKKNALMGVFFYALFCVSRETLPRHSLIH